jgi:VWFA-related protein
VRRTIALVVDDFGLSFGSIHFVRQALRKFVDEQMQPGDLVAIVLTRGSAGALQQFTSDRRILYAAIDRVRWNPRSRGQGEAPAPGFGDSTQTVLGSLQQLREDLFTVGTLGTLKYIVGGMRQLPGRKSVLLFSDGFKIFLTKLPPLNMKNPDTGPDPSDTRDRILESLKRLTDLANRSSVVVYTINASGLKTYNEDAATDLSGSDLNKGGDQFTDRLLDRRIDSFDSQTGLSYLGQQTGGFSVYGTNDLVSGIKRVLDDQKGYYLIAYHPDQSTFAPGKEGYKRFHKIVVKVKRAGLRVRSRTGFYGVPDQVARPVPRTRNEQLIFALDSPFKATGVDMRTTSLFANDAQTGSFMRTLLHINARDLTFTEEPGGWHASNFDVLAVTFGNSGQVVDEMGRTHTIRVSEKAYGRIIEHGFDYLITVPVKKPGAYQLRVSLRDTASERLGSASEFIEVPDLTKNRVALSGIILSGSEPAAAGQTGAATPTRRSEDAPIPAQSLAQRAETEVSTADTEAGPTLRRLHRGMTLKYTYVIYNAQLNHATQQPQLTTQMRLYRDGQQIFAGRVQPLDTTGQPDFKRIEVDGGLIIGPQLSPGEYVLQVTVTDELGKGKENTTTQWIDFEIAG